MESEASIVYRCLLEDLYEAKVCGSIPFRYPFVLKEIVGSLCQWRELVRMVKDGDNYLTVLIRSPRIIQNLKK